MTQLVRMEKKIQSTVGKNLYHPEEYLHHKLVEICMLKALLVRVQEMSNMLLENGEKGILVI